MKRSSFGSFFLKMLFLMSQFLTEIVSCCLYSTKSGNVWVAGASYAKINVHIEIGLFGHQISRVMRNPYFCICKNKDADQRPFSLHLFIQSFYFLNPKFQASSHLLWQYSPVCMGLGRKPRSQVFS